MDGDPELRRSLHHLCSENLRCSTAGVAFGVVSLVCFLLGGYLVLPPFIKQDLFLEPRTFRSQVADVAGVEDVNTLPRLVGSQQAALLFYTGRRIPGDEAVRIGLADLLVAQEEVRSAAQALALEIAQSSPLAVLATRETVRRGLIDAVEAATERELVEQDWLRRTDDFQEGIKAYAERRLPNFQGR
jgi:hypothetical protein